MSLFDSLFKSTRDENSPDESAHSVEIEVLEERIVLSSIDSASPSADDLPGSTNDSNTPQHPSETAELITQTNHQQPQKQQPQTSPPETEQGQTLQQQTNPLPELDTTVPPSILPGAFETPVQSTETHSEEQEQSSSRRSSQETENGSQSFDPLPEANVESQVGNETEIDLSSIAPPVSRETAVFSHSGSPQASAPWFADQYEAIEIRYDFRDANGYANEISEEQIALAGQALQAWTNATDGKVTFVRDTNAADDEIVIIGVGNLAAFDQTSQVHGTLGVAGARVEPQDVEVEEPVATDDELDVDETPAPTHANVVGMIWLDHAESWENTYNNGDVHNTYDFFTVMAHETGHIVGLDDLLAGNYQQLMNPRYVQEHGEESIEAAFQSALFIPLNELQTGTNSFVLHSMVGFPQLTEGEVQDLLDFGSRVSASEDAIIAIVDRNGNVLGVRAEQDVLDNFAGDPNGLAFAIDGAIAKARTAAFFSNGDPTNGPSGTFAPLTSRLVRFISQSTVTEREVDSNPNITDPNSVIRGPGFVAPIGLGGHFPPDVPNTPPVDLFGIEHTNRDSIIHPGADGIKGTGDDVTLRGRFNIDPAFVPAGQELPPPESYGRISGINPGAQSRGIATLPGGIPLFRDTTGDGNGDTLIGGVGVFFPGPDGYATFEQGFVPGIGQTSEQRTNADKVLEAEVIAFAIAGGSRSGASFADNLGAKDPIAALHPVPDLDVPFGRLDLVGVQLAALGPTAGIAGIRQTVELAEQILANSPLASSGADQRISALDEDVNANTVLDPGEDLNNDGVLNTVPDFYRPGESVPEGWLVTPHASAVDNITAADVTNIINEAIAAAQVTRAAVRLEGGDSSPGARTRMVFAVTDTTGEVLGLFRMQDATVFSIDVAVAKARNVAYYADPADVQAIDKVTPFANATPQPNPLPADTAFSNRTFRFLAEPRFPDGVDDGPPPPFSILNDGNIDRRTGENLGAPDPASAFTSVLGNDAFNPNTNFRDPGDAGVVAAGGVASPTANQNGIVFFPGSTPLYKDGNLIGGFGVSGDGVDQDDVVTFLGGQGFLPDGETVTRADQVSVFEVRLPFQKFLRNPFG